jgi:uncharacterized membrane protein
MQASKCVVGLQTAAAFFCLVISSLQYSIQNAKAAAAAGLSYLCSLQTTAAFFCRVISSLQYGQQSVK